MTMLFQPGWLPFTFKTGAARRAPNLITLSPVTSFPVRLDSEMELEGNFRQCLISLHEGSSAVYT